MALALSVVWSVFAAEPEKKVYGVKSGHYVYAISMFGFEMGKLNVWFDDYGLKSNQATVIELMGEKSEITAIINGEKKMVRTVEDGEEKIEISPVEPSDYGEYVFLDSLSEEELKQAEVEYVGEGEIDGRKTRIFKKKVEKEGVVAWAVVQVWEGIPLDVSMELQGAKMSIMRLETLETDIDVDPALFVIPAEA